MGLQQFFLFSLLDVVILIQAYYSSGLDFFGFNPDTFLIITTTTKQEVLVVVPVLGETTCDLSTLITEQSFFCGRVKKISVLRTLVLQSVNKCT